MIELILRVDVDKLGKTADVVKVKDGFARNYLIARGLAFPASPRNLKRIEEERQIKLQTLAKQMQDAKIFAEKLNGVSCTITALAQPDDELYGSITSQDIAKALESEGFAIDKKDIILPEPIKKLGIYEIEVKLHPEVLAKIKAWVVKK